MGSVKSDQGSEVEHIMLSFITDAAMRTILPGSICCIVHLS